MISSLVRLDTNLNVGASYVVFGCPTLSLLSNQLTITKGQTLLLNSSNLNATYVKNSTQNPNIFFTVSTVQHGYFSLINNTFSSIAGFLQQQVIVVKCSFLMMMGRFLLHTMCR